MHPLSLSSVLLAVLLSSSQGVAQGAAAARPTPAPSTTPGKGAEAIAPAPAGAELRLVAGSGLRVRAAPDAASEELLKLPLGAVLPCLARTKAVQVGDQKAPFCRTRLADGREAFFVEPLTRPFSPARAEEAWSALAAERMQELGGCQPKRKEDVWGLHHFLLERAAASGTPAERARWELLELRLLAQQACLFLGGDARIYRDEAQGARLAREAIWAFVDRSQGTPAAQEGAWFAVAHGHDFECEGQAPCYFAWTQHLECEYLRRFPRGPHASQAVKGITEAAQEYQRALSQGEVAPEATELSVVTQVKGCLEGVSAPEARAARGALDKLLAQLRKPAPASP